MERLLCHSLLALFLFVFCCDEILLSVRAENGYISAVGDPGMRRDGLRVAIESWNQCNEVGEEAPVTGSPRLADCFDVYKTSPVSKGSWFLITKFPFFFSFFFVSFSSKFDYNTSFNHGMTNSFLHEVSVFFLLIL